MIDCRLPDRPETNLDAALMDPEGLLSSSLKCDERKRRKRWIWISACSTLLLALAGVFAASAIHSPAAAAAVNESSEKTTQGWELWKQRKLEDAELTFLDALRLNENDAEAWSGVGWCRNNRGLHDTAIEAFRKCLALNPHHGAAMNGIGQSSLAIHDWKEAEKWLYKGSKEFLELIPEEKITANNLPATWYGLVQVYLITEQYNKAEEWAKRLVKYKPDDTIVLSLLLQAKSKDNSRIKEQFKKIHERTRVSKSWQNFSQGRNADAEKGFREALAKDKTNPDLMNGLAFALLNSGKNTEAKPLFEKCLELKPAHYGAMNGLGRCLHAEGKTDEAISIWEDLCQKVKTPNAATAALGSVYLERKEYQKAIKYLKQLTELKGTPSPTIAIYKKMLEKAEAGLAKEESE